MLQKIIDYIAKLLGLREEKDEKDKGKPSDDIYPLY